MRAMKKCSAEQGQTEAQLTQVRSFMTNNNRKRVSMLYQLDSVRSPASFEDVTKFVAFYSKMTNR
jgi:hypothetical protein